MVAKILLEVILCPVRAGGGNEFGNDRPFPDSLRSQFVDQFARDLFLFRRLVEDDGPALRADIIPLPIERL